MEIKPLIGYGHIKLGITQDEALKLLGEPQSKDINDYTDNEYSEIWRYFDQGFELGFDSEDDLLLCSIAVYARNAVLDEKKPIGMHEAELLKAFPAVRLDQDFEEFGKCFCDDDRCLMFWTTEEEVLEYITVMPEFADNDEDIIWPE